MSVQCQLEPQHADQPLTVGQSFYWICEGELGDLPQSPNPQFVVNPEDKYKLQKLDFEQVNAHQVSFRLVSYQVGTHEVKAIQWMDSDKSVLLGDLSFTVQSSQKNPPATEPYSFSDYLLAPWPWFFVLALIGLGLLALGGGLQSLVQKKKVRTWVKENQLEKKSSSVEIEVYRRLREIQKRKDQSKALYLEGLQNLALLVLSWGWQIPGPQWGAKKSLKKLKKKNTSENLYRSTVLLFQELDLQKKSQKTELHQDEKSQLESLLLSWLNAVLKELEGERL